MKDKIIENSIIEFINSKQDNYEKTYHIENSDEVVIVKFEKKNKSRTRNESLRRSSRTRNRVLGSSSQEGGVICPQCHGTGSI